MLPTGVKCHYLTSQPLPMPNKCANCLHYRKGDCLANRKQIRNVKQDTLVWRYIRVKKSDLCEKYEAREAKERGFINEPECYTP